MTSPLRNRLKARANIIQTVRNFFDTRGFVHVDPPVFQTCPSFDPHIGAFKIDGANHYLRTSPELEMKKLLSAGAGDIYTIGPNFRRDNCSDLHAPEFTMIEWYRVGADYTAIINDCIELIRNVSDTYSFNGLICDPRKKWQRLSVVEAFDLYADIDLFKYLPSPTHARGLKSFRNEATRLKIRTTDKDTWDDIFHAIMAQKIEPHLGLEAPYILYDYPISQAALARKKPDDRRFAERFELYICGVELANAFSELTNPVEQRARFNADMALRQSLYGNAYPADETFFAALENGLPDCAGIALGIDRLVMLATGADSLLQTYSFS